MDVAQDHVYQIAAALAGINRGGIDRREDPLGAQRFRQHGAGMHAVTHVRYVALQERILDLRLQKIERPQDWKARLDEGRKLLVKDDEVFLFDANLTFPLARQGPALRSYRYRKKTLLLQMVPNFLECLADQGGAHDLTTRLGVLAVKLHF